MGLGIATRQYGGFRYYGALFGIPNFDIHLHMQLKLMVKSYQMNIIVMVHIS